MVDVMLVLLIIFMVTAPMMEQGFDVNLPVVSDAQNLKQQKEPIIVVVKKDGSIFVAKSAVKDRTNLVAALKTISGNKRLDSVLIEADTEVPYGKVIEVMASIQEAGIEKVGMVTRPVEKD